jgi:hypothetical protein
MHLANETCEVVATRDKKLESTTIANKSIPPDPIVLTFCFQDQTYIKRLDYTIFAAWNDVQGLFDELSKDGITCDELWDVNEDMPVSSGDWDARVRPGCVVEALCFCDQLELDWVDESSSDSAGDVDEDEDDDIANGVCAMGALRREHVWWFARWRERVEKETSEVRETMQEPSCLAMVVWCFCMVVIVVVLSLLST